MLIQCVDDINKIGQKKIEDHYYKGIGGQAFIIAWKLINITYVILKYILVTFLTKKINKKNKRR